MAGRTKSHEQHSSTAVYLFYAHVTTGQKRLWCVLIRMSEKVLRVSQLDATELDDELLSVLQEQLVAVLKVLPSTRLLRFKPELRAVLKALLWGYSVRSLGQTFGQSMLDIKYSTDATCTTTLSYRHKWALLFLSVGVEWLRERFHLLVKLVLQSHTPRRVELILGYLTTAVNSLSLFNFTVFLLRGCYPTLSERLCGLLIAPSKPQTLRNMSYDYMNREILWHGFSEFLFFIIPHFNMFALRNWLHRVTLSPTSSPVDYSMCVFCEKPPTRPSITQCGHVYCHYCLQANCMADSHFPCSVCGQIVYPPRGGPDSVS